MAHDSRFSPRLSLVDDERCSWGSPSYRMRCDMRDSFKLVFDLCCTEPLDSASPVCSFRKYPKLHLVYYYAYSGWAAPGPVLVG
jgi:hypothetical protein